MRVAASESAIGLIRERGGRLYVWTRKSRCCGVRTLRASSEPPPGLDFLRVPGVAGFELFLPARLAPRPEELRVEVRGLRSRIEAYWDGCAWVT